MCTHGHTHIYMCVYKQTSHKMRSSSLRQKLDMGVDLPNHTKSCTLAWPTEAKTYVPHSSKWCGNASTVRHKG